MPFDSIPGVIQVADTDCALFILWTKYGKWESEGPKVFTERAVQRQDGHLRASAGVDVPDSCTVLQLSDKDRAEYGLSVSDILIRDDYLKSLCDICHLSTQPVLPPQNNTVEGPIRFYNPFFDNEVQSKECAVTVLGHPGIGKSLWLIVVLVLRILAGYPTIYYSSSNILYIFNADGLYRVDPTNLEFKRARAPFYKAISPQYWCLVDCNRDVVDVPFFLSRTRAFIVQTASPRSERIDWVKKYQSTSTRYFTKNWTLPELIIGRALQPPERQCSEQHLEVFYSRYAPSARMAYAYADNMDDYEQIVDREIYRLTFEIGEILSGSAEALQVEHVSHHILLVNPQQSNRSDQLITIPSHYLYNKIRDRLHIHTLEEAARLYQIFVRNPYTRSADYILDDIHDLFCNGGEWRLVPMTKNKSGPVNTHFKSPTRGSLMRSWYMRLGYKGEHLTIARCRLAQGAVFTPLAHHRFLLGQNIGLEDGYYQPAPGQPTFDGFIYDPGTQTATMLHMTVATHHDVKVRVMEWLMSQGVKRIRLVAVKPPNTLLDLPVPNNLTPLIMDSLELVLESVQS
ncbi:hypothetical protein M378DRAFT_201760 [Amanita muscaria Koide BX008]|uniref:Uncharacterized protein n=1 Tax=Amanita muscaria (strain Koide BX008) TaxID=946122 RepID=A0A0C2XPL4_AMAMK|nr:hypothetical protein M378DRAFT_201760 [Amanita muscaria Koide BX008]